jgi:hypothetical protein
MIASAEIPIRRLRLAAAFDGLCISMATGRYCVWPAKAIGNVKH